MAQEPPQQQHQQQPPAPGAGAAPPGFDQAAFAALLASQVSSAVGRAVGVAIRGDGVQLDEPETGKSGDERTSQPTFCVHLLAELRTMIEDSLFATEPWWS